jgi:general secretion pathway protein M
MEGLIQWWRSIARRERRMIVAAALVILVAVGYLVSFEPAWRGREQIGRELPLLRAQVAQMDALGKEARRLAAAPAGVDTPQALRAVFEQSVGAAGLKAHLSQINLTGDVLDVRFSGVPFAEWLVWFDAALRETRLRVIDASIQREAASGQVSIRLALEAPKRDGK